MNPFPVDDLISKKYTQQEKDKIKSYGTANAVAGGVLGGYTGAILQSARNATLPVRQQAAASRAQQQRNKTVTMKQTRSGAYKMPKQRAVKWPKPMSRGGWKGAAVGAGVAGALGVRDGMNEVKQTRARKAAREQKKAAMVSKSVWGVDHQVEIGKSFKDVSDLSFKKEHKAGRKIMRRERLKGQLKGAGIGAGAGAAAGLGTAAVTRGRVNPTGAAGLGAIGGALAGQQVGDEIGRRKAFKKGAFPGYSATTFGTRKVEKSFWGVDHGLISKASNQRSGERAVIATLVPGIHGAVAGKKGKKIKAAATGLGGSVAGGFAGSVLTRGNATASSIGSLAGGYGAYRVNAKKGRYKPVKAD